MVARPGLDFLRRKWLRVTINDDFLEEGEVLRPATPNLNYPLLCVQVTFITSSAIPLVTSGRSVKRVGNVI